MRNRARAAVLAPAEAFLGMGWPARAAFLCGWAWLLLGLATFHLLTFDDVFIPFRYARNLVDGRGYVFNPGEAVEGASSPLWVFFLAAARWAGADLLTAAKECSAACALFVPWVTIGLVARVVPDGPALAGGWLIALAAPLSLWGVNGLETAAYALAVSAGLLLAMDDLEPGRGVPRGAWAFAIGCWLRPEGALLAAPYLLALLYRAWRGRVAPSTAGWACAIVLGSIAALAGWRLVLFGVPVPNTYFVKLGSEGAWRARLTPGYLQDAVVRVGGVPLLCLVAAPFIVRGARTWPAALLAATAACQAGFIIWTGGDWMPGDRFFVPVLPALLALAGSGTAQLWRDAGAALGGRGRGIVLAFAISLTFTQARSARTVLEETTGPYAIGLGRGHGAMADWLVERAPADCVVALSDVGWIPWRTGLVTIDLGGLCDAFIARHRPAESARDVVERRRPGVIILSLCYGSPRFLVEREIVRRAAFQRGWRPLWRTHFADDDSYDLVAYVRNDLVPAFRRLGDRVHHP